MCLSSNGCPTLSRPTTATQQPRGSGRTGSCAAGALRGLAGRAARPPQEKGPGQRRRQYGKHAGDTPSSFRTSGSGRPAATTHGTALSASDGGNGSACAFQENHGQAILRWEKSWSWWCRPHAARHGHVPGQRVHERRLAPGPTPSAVIRERLRRRSGQTGLQAATSSWLSEQGAFFRWISRQVSAAGVTLKCAPPGQGYAGVRAQSFSPRSGGQAGNGGQSRSAGRRTSSPCAERLDQLVLPHQIAAYFTEVSAQKDFFRKSHCHAGMQALAVPASWTDA